MHKTLCIRNIIESKSISTLPNLINELSTLFKDSKLIKLESITSSIVDPQFLSDLRFSTHDVNFAFGKTLKDVKCSLKDEDLRSHELLISYEGIKKLKISSVDIPHAPFLEHTYSNIEEVVVAFTNHIKKLQSYFYELENIDNNCVVLEPIKPTFKDDFRNIQIDDKTWLHIEITSEGSPTNVHLIGQSQKWQDKLRDGILNWDHDKNIVDNITTIFDLNNQSLLSKSLCTAMPCIGNTKENDALICGICFCFELPDIPGVPQPLCQNSNCDVHFHKNCLFQWLVACSGGRPPSFGVINGHCPTCLQPISCSDKADIKL